MSRYCLHTEYLSLIKNINIDYHKLEIIIEIINEILTFFIIVLSLYLICAHELFPILHDKN